MSDTTPEEYASWIVANKDKKGTPEFESVAKAYQQSLEAEGAAPAPAPTTLPTAPETEEMGFF